MIKQFIILLGFALCNFRELLHFVQQTRRTDCDVHGIEPHEYHELTIPHYAVRKVVDKLFAGYLDRHKFSPFDFMDRMVEDSLGSLVPISVLSKSHTFAPRDFMAFFNESKEVKLKYNECFKIQKSGESLMGCFKVLFHDVYEGVNLKHASNALFSFITAKSIIQANRLPAFSSPVHIPLEDDYCEGMYNYLCENAPLIVNDRLVLLPEVIYAISMFRYVYHMALFLGKLELSKEVYGRMKVLLISGSVFINSFVQTEQLPTSHRIFFKDKVMLVDSILTLGVPQRQRLRNEVVQIFFKDNKMYVSFPQYCNAAQPSIVAAAKKFLLTNLILKKNPTSLPIQ